MADRQPALFRIEPIERSYAWGSVTAIPRLLGRAPSDEPVAELWFGAHSDSPSTSSDGPLDGLIAADPVRLLGSAVAGRFGDRLPFLLKILAADRALSVQVHPNLDQARAGYADEQARGVALNDPGRNYRDPNHKPELLCALTDFDALCGFRPIEQSLALLDALAVSALSPVVTALRGERPLRAAFELLLDWPIDERAALIDLVVGACARLVDSEWSAAARATILAAEDFPGDIGAVVALLLNAVRLRPGEAIYLGAGNVHAYLRGLGVEVMANSDNVLRCGLTPKHVDVPEVLRVAEFTPLVEPRCVPREVSPAERVFEVAVADFRLSTFALQGAGTTITATAPGPQVLLCVEGNATVNGLALAGGQAVFAAAGHEVGLEGSGLVFRATVGTDDSGIGTDVT